MKMILIAILAGSVLLAAIVTPSPATTNPTETSMKKYRYIVECPRCNKASYKYSDSLTLPHVNCGDCLMDHTEIVEMKVVSVSEVRP